ncbi:histone-fold-containing protein [Lactarius psammicola]|nr:histone-fold-containing protein [Lactarius psammicola]
MPRRENANTPASAQAQQDAVSEGIENFELPRALVTRIAKSAVPENVKLQKDTVLSLVKGATVFINYLAATAHEVSTSKQHKSISASDVFKALEIIEFADLIPPLQAELQIYRELSKSKKGSVAGGASSSAPPARSKSGGGGGSAAAQRGKGKERTTDSAESHISAPLPGALGALSLDPQPRVQVHAPSVPPDTDAETHVMAEPEPEPDVGEGEGEGEGEGVDEEDDEDQTEPEVGLDEAEEDEAEEDEADEDVDVEVDVDVDVDVDMDTNALEDRDDMADGEME